MSTKPNIELLEAAPLQPAASLQGATTNKKLEELKARLNQILVEKKKSDASLAEIEYAIYNFEGSYLEETHNGKGNLIRGFGKYPKNALDKNNPKKFEVREEDRIFSRGSVTYEQSVAMKREQGPSSSSTADAKGSTTKPNSRKRKKGKFIGIGSGRSSKRVKIKQVTDAKFNV